MEAAMLRAVLVFLGIPLGIALVVFGGVSALNAASLQSQGKVVQATITQSQKDDQGAPEIRYEFRLSNGATVYSHGDETGRRNLWVNVSEAPSGKTVEVRYLPSNPWVNLPANATSNPLQSSLVALGVGVVLVLMGGLLLISDIRSRRRKKATQGSAGV
jgi:hypothetical protein